MFFPLLAVSHCLVKMDNIGKNDTNSSTKGNSCEFGQSQNFSLAVTDIITFLIGLPLITKLLWLTLTSKKDKDILNVNLAIFHHVQYLMSILHLISLFAIPQIQMQILSFLIVYGGLGGPLNLAFICMQRYVAVIHPTSYPMLKKYRCREIWALMVWMISVPIAFANLFAGGQMPSIREDMINSVSFSVTLLLAAVIIRFSVSIAMTLKKSGPGEEKLSPAKRRAFTIVCATSFITLSFYIPVALLQKFRTINEYMYECIVKPVCILLLSVASVVHPLFYLYTQGKSSVEKEKRLTVRTTNVTMLNNTFIP